MMSKETCQNSAVMESAIVTRNHVSTLRETNLSRNECIFTEGSLQMTEARSALLWLIVSSDPSTPCSFKCEAHV